MHTPFTIRKAFKNGIAKFTEIKTVVEITGVYKEAGEILYNIFYKTSNIKFYFDYLIDRETNDKITILVSEEKRALLKNQKAYKLRCFADVRNDKESTVKLFLFVEEVIDDETTNFGIVIDPEKKRVAHVKSEMLRNFRLEKIQQDVSLALKIRIQKQELPKVALVQPLVNKTLKDIKGCLGQHYDKYNFVDFRVNIKNEQEVIKTLKKIDSERNFNLIGLFRGGGEEEDFDVFDSIEMGVAVIDLQTPFVMAVGHADDEPFAQKVSDRSFNTPSDFGSYLKDVYVNSGREDDLTEREKTLNNFQDDLNAKRVELQKKESALYEQARNIQNQSSLSKEAFEELATTEEDLKTALGKLETAEKEKLTLIQHNQETQKQIELSGNKIRTTKYAVIAALLVSIFVGVAAYFITKYFFDAPEAAKIVFTDTNSNLKPSSNVSSSKNK